MRATQHAARQALILVGHAGFTNKKTKNKMARGGGGGGGEVARLSQPLACSRWQR